MKHCYHCGRITAGDPLFCNTCGRSFDKKLCPRHHPNPRSAEICSRCGSRELSTPQPKVSLGWKFLEWLTRMSLGGVLVIVAIFFAYEVLNALLGSEVVQSGLVLLGMLLIVLSWIWGKLPEWFRKFVRKQVHTRRDRHEEE
jgi:RNA polymerase subunit RPABC4/transcription elongation factor Spt4